MLALDVMRLFIYDAERPAEGEQQPPVAGAVRRARADSSAAAIAEMEQAIETPRPIAEIARACGCSQRKLERAFERALGVTPQRYYQYLRLAAGRRMLLDGSQSVTLVAARTGFSTATSFARAYRRMFGHAPKQALSFASKVPPRHPAVRPGRSRVSRRQGLTARRLHLPVRCGADRPPDPRRSTRRYGRFTRRPERRKPAAANRGRSGLPVVGGRRFRG
ncbi:MAG: helix-turn-helix domain-containing protein [Rhodovibrio sp.]|nr:helix-turn-helix domain-containing protein [Rhodovibrio sp.]